MSCLLPLGSPFVAALVYLDDLLGEDLRAGNCQVCGSALHLDCFPRKPRGVPPEWVAYFDYRVSLTCSICDKRHTPASARFLERRIYVSFVVVLTCAARAGLTDFRLKKLTAWFAVPRRTLERWCVWWRTTFATSRFFKIERGQFPAQPPIGAALPASLLAQFKGDDLPSRLGRLLLFLAPLSKGRRSSSRGFNSVARRLGTVCFTSLGDGP